MSFFTTTDQFRAVEPVVNKAMAFATLLPFIIQAEEKYIRPLLGDDFFDELDAAFAGTPSNEQAAAILRIQRALAKYAMYEALPSLSAQASSAGFQEVNSQNNSVPRQWVYKENRAQMLEQGDVFFEALLQFLEKNKADYGTWTSSDNYLATLELFIASGTELAAYITVAQPHRFYLAIRPHIKNIAEDKWITKNIGPELFEEIKDEMAAGSISAENENLLKYIRPLVAFAGVLEAMPFITIRVGADGARVVASDSVLSEALQVGMAGSPGEVLAAYREGLLDRTQSLQKRLMDFLYANASDYPLFEDSDFNLSSLPTAELHDNSNSETFMV